MHTNHFHCKMFVGFYDTLNINHILLDYFRLLTDAVLQT